MQTLYIHPDNPQARLIGQICDALNQNEIIICPNAGVYHFVLPYNAKQAVETLNRVQQADFAIACQSISEMANFAEISNEHFRQIKANDGKSVVFRLIANKNTPKFLIHDKRKTIDLTPINHPILQAIAEQFEQPLAIVPVLQSDTMQAETLDYEIQDKFDKIASHIVHDDAVYEQLPEVLALYDE